MVSWITVFTSAKIYDSWTNPTQKWRKCIICEDEHTAGFIGFPPSSAGLYREYSVGECGNSWNEGHKTLKDIKNPFIERHMKVRHPFEYSIWKHRRKT